jgi:hypothetical protein
MANQTIVQGFFLILLFVGFNVNNPVPAQNAGDSAAPYEALRHELIKMGKEDQKYRQEMMDLMKKLSGPDSKRTMKRFEAVGKRQDLIDRKNMKRLDEIVQRYGWPTKSMVGAQASGVAFLIVQHGDVSHMKKYFPLVNEAASRNEAEPRDAAMLEDRILMNEGKKQIYGTQLRTDNLTKELKLWPIENEEEVDARRAAVGLMPMAEYLKMFGLQYTPPKKND